MKVSQMTKENICSFYCSLLIGLHHARSEGFNNSSFQEHHSTPSRHTFIEKDSLIVLLVQCLQEKENKLEFIQNLITGSAKYILKLAINYILKL